MTEVLEEIEHDLGAGAQDVERGTSQLMEDATEGAERELRPMEVSGVFFKQPLKSIRSNGMNFFANYKGEGGGILVVEPYIWFILGVIVSIAVAVNSGGANISSELSWIWIIFGVWIMFVTGMGKNKAEG